MNHSIALIFREIGKLAEMALACILSLQFSDVERAILLCSDGAAAGDALYNSITVKLKNFPDQHSPESFF